jgi:hypothetical protein
LAEQKAQVILLLFDLSFEIGNLCLSSEVELLSLANVSQGVCTALL